MGMTPIQRYRLKQSLARIRNKKQYLLEMKKQQKRRKKFFRKFKKVIEVGFWFFLAKGVFWLLVLFGVVKILWIIHSDVGTLREVLQVPRTAKIAESKQIIKKKSEISLNSSMFNIYEKILLWCCCGYMSYVLICMILGTLEIL